jgi:hypothetical protein
MIPFPERVDSRRYILVGPRLYRIGRSPRGRIGRPVAWVPGRVALHMTAALSGLPCSWREEARPRPRLWRGWMTASMMFVATIAVIVLVAAASSKVLRITL